VGKGCGLIGIEEESLHRPRCNFLQIEDNKCFIFLGCLVLLGVYSMTKHGIVMICVWSMYLSHEVVFPLQSCDGVVRAIIEMGQIKREQRDLEEQVYK